MSFSTDIIASHNPEFISGVKDIPYYAKLDRNLNKPHFIKPILSKNAYQHYLLHRKQNIHIFASYFVCLHWFHPLCFII